MTDTPDAEQLDEIEEHIDKARDRAEDAGILVDEHEEEDEEEFADSGATPASDDQTIAPPG
jgi:phage shock protein A